MKPIEDSFTDWESATFGFGYGTGEEHTIGALRDFFMLVGMQTDAPHSYDYRMLESGLGARVAWLLINALGKANIIEYGTSPRFGWLTEEGKRLKDFMLGKSLDDIVALTSRDQDYSYCYPDACNCGPSGYVAGKHCDNPFWEHR
jgi:hypothetical protein